MTALPRLGVVVRGRLTGTTWSGIPAGLLRGIDACGSEVVVCDGEVGRGVPTLVNAWLRVTGRFDAGWAYSPEMTAARQRTARRRSRSLPPVDGWIVVGSQMGVPVRGPFVTFEDLTVAEAERHPGWYFPRLSERSSRRWRASQAALYARARRCCVATDWAAGSLRRDYGVDDDTIEVVGFGRNLEVAPPAGRDWSTPHYLFVGLDWERKNGPAVVDAFAQVRRVVPGARLTVVGGHPRLDVPGVRGLGPLRLDRPSDRDLLAELFRTSTCLVVPSRLEPFGIVYAEAAGAGLPCIGTTAGGAREAIGPAGVTVDPDDDAGLAAAMRRMADPDTARGYGAVGPAHAEAFTWPRVATRLVRALDPRPAAASLR